MRRKLRLLFCMVAVLTMAFGLQVSAAGSVTISSCLIQGNQVVVQATGAVEASDDGNYYLFALQPYETAIGARTDFCAVAPKAAAVTMATPLNLDTAASKLYCRFQVAVLKGGKFVSVSNDYYITNPEAVATHTIPVPMGPKKGLTLDWQYHTDLIETGSGYAAYELDISRFYNGGGIPYVYNGKAYEFNWITVAEYDAIATLCQMNNVHLVMVIKNTWNPATLDLIYPTGRVPNMRCYAFNTAEQGGAEKIQALMHFLAERYSNLGVGSIHSWIIGNEVNNNNSWHFTGNYNVTQFSQLYAQQVRMCYNAIKSVNANARVYINLDQRWMWEDGTANQYGGKKVLDAFNAAIASTGNIDWGLSFHPHCLPLDNAAFWNIPSAYRALNLVSNNANTKMLIPTNFSVLTNYMMRPELMSPYGTPRHLIISEMLFTSAHPRYKTSEQIQAAAMVYAYKIMSQQPLVEAVIIHRQVDHPYEIADSNMACGLRRADGTPKFAYEVYKYMDHPNSPYTDFALPIIGASSWAQLGVQ